MAQYHPNHIVADQFWVSSAHHIEPKLTKLKVGMELQFVMRMMPIIFHLKSH